MWHGPLTHSKMLRHAHSIPEHMQAPLLQPPCPLHACRFPESTQATATFLAKADGVLAGLAVADEVFRIVDASLVVEWSAAGAPWSWSSGLQG